MWKSHQACEVQFEESLLGPWPQNKFLGLS